jgi:pSer/pThr/pTyr-binding forkhead associated (FHA) protein
MAPPPPAAAKGITPPPAVSEPERAVPDLRAASAAPDPDGVFAFGEDDLAADAIEPARAADVPTGPLTGPNPEHTSLFDFGGPATAELAAPEVAPTAAPAAPEESENAAPLYAGLIVQREGKLHLLRPWEGGELCAGRAPECEIVLADAGVSRRHVLFSHGPGGHVVRDLGSVNGIYVNGNRTKQHVLSVGDVVRVESFELTFVLDRQPIGSEVSGPAPAAPRPQENGRATQFSLEAPALENEEAFDLAPLAGDPSEPPGAASYAPFEANTDGFEAIPAPDEAFAAAPIAPAIAEAALPEADLIAIDASEDDEEKDATVQADADAQVLGFAAALATRRGVQLRLRLDSAQLSARAREALAVLAEEGVALGAQISFERESES